MIARYTKKEMGQVWEQANKFQKMMEVEIAVAQVQAEMGIIPKVAAKDITKKSKFNVQRIEEIEAVTKHDVIAFVSNLAENVGKNGRYIHFGLTSSDVIDTALSLQIKDAYTVLFKSLKYFESNLKKKIRQHKYTMCSGRTHGMHAEPTTFGLKLSGIYAEFQRNMKRVETACKQAMICKLSGAVGTYSAQSMTVENKVAKKLKLQTEVIATQVIPRDRHAEVMSSLAILGGCLERLSVELRHLQRTEVGEVYEGFSKGQKGSSAMPHKKNPISSENITGVARLLRSYASSSLENIALWHERDISHSSVERVIFPDAFILAHYAVERMSGVVENLQVDKQRMIKNMNLSKGQLFSSHILLLLVKKGLSRERAYELVQSCSHGLQDGESLKDALFRDPEISSRVSTKEIEDVFSGKAHQKQILKVIERVFKRRK